MLTRQDFEGQERPTWCRGCGNHAILNAVKVLAGIPNEIDLLPEMLIRKIATLKKDIMGRKSESLNVQEVLIALTISAATSQASEVCLTS